jgi:hypothetical protein
MTFWAFAADHPILALLFAGLAFSLPVTLAALFVSWRVSRPVRYSAEDRKALTSAAARLRYAAMKWAADGHYAARDSTRDEAEELERIASR